MAVESVQSIVTCATVTRGLLGHLRLHAASSIVLPNVYVGYSPWECDAIRVSKTYHWVEYEVKVSVADYRADFFKRQIRWKSDSLLKHDAYKSDEPIEVRSSYMDRITIIPKPKQFYFVVPKGLLDAMDVPPHAGIIEFDADGKRDWGIKVKRRAPNLKQPTKLDAKTVFNLAAKASHRLALPSM